MADLFYFFFRPNYLPVVAVVVVAVESVVFTVESAGAVDCTVVFTVVVSAGAAFPVSAGLLLLQAVRTITVVATKAKNTFFISLNFSFRINLTTRKYKFPFLVIPNFGIFFFISP
jgi:hypothetical protein